MGLDEIPRELPTFLYETVLVGDLQGCVHISFAGALSISLLLLEGNTLQPVPATEADLRDFYVQHGTSARDSYAAHASPKGPALHVAKLEQAVHKMAWAALDTVMSAEDFIPDWESKTSYHVVLIILSASLLAV